MHALLRTPLTCQITQRLHRTIWSDKSRISSEKCRTHSAGRGTVVVVGAGIVGVTTAYYLRQAGFDVTVIEQRSQAGFGCSFANAGILSRAFIVPEPHASVSHAWSLVSSALTTKGDSESFPWRRLCGPPGGESDCPGPDLSDRGPFRTRIRVTLELVRWGWHFIQATMPWSKSAFLNRATDSLLLSDRTQQEVRNLVDQHGLSIGSGRPFMEVYLTQEALQARARECDAIMTAISRRSPGLATIVELSRPRFLSRSEVLHHEPFLKHSCLAKQVVGAVFGQNDAVGDAHRFTTQLSEVCRQQDVKFMWNTGCEKVTVEQVEPGGSIKATGVLTDRGVVVCADHVVVCAAHETPSLLRRSGLYGNLPMQPVKGHSLTIPLPPELHHVSTSDTIPRGSVALHDTHCVITNLGDRIRATTGADFLGADTTINPEHAEILLRELHTATPRLVQSLPKQFELGAVPASGDAMREKFRRGTGVVWSGLRPMSPDGMPFVGTLSGCLNLHLNTGHGTWGWAMGCGSAQLCVHHITGDQYTSLANELQGSTSVNRYQKTPWKYIQQ